MRRPRSLFILLPFALMVLVSLTVLWITVGDRDASDPAAGGSGRAGAQERIVERLGLEVAFEGGELEFERGDLTCSVDRVLATQADVDEAVRTAPRRVAVDPGGSAGVLLTAEEEDVGACAAALERRLRAGG